MKSNHPIVVIELDGADWHVIKPMLAAGRLPNIAKMMEEGSSGDLVSSPPLISPRLWVSIFSGKGSKEHGVEFFGSSTSMVKVKRVWDILAERGSTVGVIGTFVTWPPYPVRGFMIPSLFALGPETWPEEYSFYQELTLRERKKGKAGMFGKEAARSSAYYAAKLATHGVSPATLARAALQQAAAKVRPGSADDRFWKRAAMHTRITTEFLVHLMKKHQPDFLTYHIHLCDAFAHRYWKYHEPEAFTGVDPADVARYGQVIPRGYEEADRTVGVLRKASPDANFLLISDHGTMAMESLRNSYRLSIESFLQMIGLDHQVIPANVGFMTFLYFNEQPMMVETRKVLEAVRFRDDGRPVFDVFNEESLLGLRLTNDLWGKEVPEDREIDVAGRASARFADLFLPHRMEVSGTHRLEGIAVLAGPDFRKGGSIEGATIFDITPTILALAGLPAADDMPGRVLERALAPGLLAGRPASRIATYETGTPGAAAAEPNPEASEKVKSRLRSLGYL